MFERFAADARAAVTQSQDIARRRGDTQITSAHLLLAVAGTPGTVAADALTALDVTEADLRPAVDRALGAEQHTLDPDALAGIGIDLGAVRRQVEDSFGSGALDRPVPAGRRRLGFSADAKALLEQSLRTAVAAHHRRLDAGHLLVAAAHLGGSPAQAALSSVGVTASRATSAVEHARVDHAA